MKEMAGKKRTVEENVKLSINRQVADYVDSVKDFLKAKGGKEAEYQVSLQMLEVYYHQFLTLNEEIKKLDSIVVDSRYGKVPSPLLTARDKTVAKLNDILKSLGCLFREQIKMDLLKVEEEEENTLSKFIKNRK